MRRWSLLVLFLLSVSLIIFFFVRRRLGIPRCPGELDPNLISCDNNGNMIQKPARCDHTSTEFRFEKLIGFLRYIRTLYTGRPRTISRFLSSVDPEVRITEGVFYFAIEDLLMILPNCFGNNFATPYGISSFFLPAVGCIHDTETFCRNLFYPDTPLIFRLCAETLSRIHDAHQPCMFQYDDTQPSIVDRQYYDYLSLLGSIAIKPSQVMILYGTIPKGFLYWSFNLYLGFRSDNSRPCHPYKGIYISSIVPPINQFQCYGLMNHDPTDPVDVRICLILSLDASMGDRVEETIRSDPSSVPVDVIHRFNIPSAPNSMRIREDLINPNHYSGTEPLYNADTDTIGIFFRCNGEDTQTFVKRPDIEVLMVEFPSTTSIVRYERTQFPDYHAPHTDERPYSIQLHRSSRWASTRLMLDCWYFPSRVGVFTSLNSVIAPLDPGVYGNRFPYIDGIEAIQMAGNAQADNHDAWYKLSHLTCLGQRDVLAGFFVNHALLRNSLFCSVNIVNKNKAFGIHEISSVRINTPYYAVVTGRDQETLSRVADSVRRACPDMFVHEFWLETGDFEDKKTPICHQILMVERTYLYPFVTGADGEEYYYDEIPEKEYTLLRTMTGVDGRRLADPVFVRYSHQPWIYIVMLVTIVVYLCFLVVLIFVKLNKNKIK